MYKEFQKFFFDDADGVMTRFRDKDFYLSKDELKMIKDYATKVNEKIKKEGMVSPGTFSDYIKVIETLNQSPDEDTMLLLQHVYSIAERYQDDN